MFFVDCLTLLCVCVCVLISSFGKYSFHLVTTSVFHRLSPSAFLIIIAFVLHLFTLFTVVWNYLICLLWWWLCYVCCNLSFCMPRSLCLSAPPFIYFCMWSLYCILLLSLQLYCFLVLLVSIPYQTTLFLKFWNAFPNLSVSASWHYLPYSFPVTLCYYI